MAIGDQHSVLSPAPEVLDAAGAEGARRRSRLLLHCAHALHSTLDIHAVVTSLAARVQEMLEADVVVLLRRRDDHFVLEALAANDPALNQSVEQEFVRGNFDFVADIAARAQLAGEPISATVGAYDAAAAIFPAPGQLLAAPLRSPEANGALVTYRATVRPFDSEERSALAALCSMGALAIENAELYARADARGRELQQLLEITSELSGTGDLQAFLERFVVRAAEFLAFQRSFIAVVEEDKLEVRCLADGGCARPIAQPLPASLAGRVQSSSDPFWSNDIREWPAVELTGLAGNDTRQVLCVPLYAPGLTSAAAHSGADLLGVLGLLDRLDGCDITAEDVRRARSLAAEVSVALQAARGLHASSEHRRRSELLMGLALELSSTLRLNEFGQSFTRRAVDTFRCRAAALCVVQDKRLEVVDLCDPLRAYDAATRYSLAAMLTEAANLHPAPVVNGKATELLGGSVSSLGWDEILLARMTAPDGSFIGCLVLVDVERRESSALADANTASSESSFTPHASSLSSDDRKLLGALVAHAAVALDNARLFTRMDQANRHWMEIFDAITDLIVVHDEDLKVLRVNRSLADFIGVSPNELIGVSMRAMIAMAGDETQDADPASRVAHSSRSGPESRIPNPASCPFCRVVSGGDEYIHPVLDRTYLVSTSRVDGAEVGLGTRDSVLGSRDPGRHAESRLPNSGGTQTIHVLKDITDRREAERRYRELFDTIQEGLFFSTPEGRFIEVNEALVRMLGYGCREDLLSVDITREIYVAPEQRALFTREIQEHGMVRNYQETLRRRDGSIIYTLQNAFAVRDSQGKVVQYRGLILDITELKTFQGELQRQRDFNTKILDNTQSMIMVVDTAGLISYGNRRCFEAGGYTQDELLGRRLVDLVPNPRRAALAASLAETLAGNQVDNIELPILLGQGRSGQFSLNLSPMRDESGHVNSIVVVMTDISDAAMLQAKLMHTEKMAAVGQLVSGVAHEVNNPLTAVLGFTDLLLENPEVPDKAKDDLKVVLQEAQRTKQIVQNLLSFARQMPPERHAVQVNLVVRRTLALRAYDFANHGIQIIERLDDAVPEIMADAHQLQQVFLNILNNAYDAVQGNDRAGRIEIATSAANGWTEVTFRDNGHGIAYPERIFDPFFTTKEVGKGTGLGLSICYGIVREHGGEILCRNNGTTPGATFTVRLPIGEGHRARAAAGGHA